MDFQKIKNYENYAISQNGDVVRYSKDGATKKVTQYKTGKGYRVKLSNSPEYREAYIHELMGETFLGAAAYHIDGDVYNNRLYNLTTVETITNYYGTDRQEIHGVAAVRINKDRWVRCDGIILDYDHITEEFTQQYIKPNKHGYIYTRVSKNGDIATCTLHRVVAELFLPNPSNLPVVDHIDENKANNSVENLRWCTYQDNSEYYMTDNGKDYRRKLQAAMGAKYKALLKEVTNEKAAVAQLRKELSAAEDELAKEKQKFTDYITKEKAAIQANKKGYHGYADVTGIQFGSLKAMTEATGKPIKVDGCEYVSCGSAAQFIVDQEAALGIIRQKPTISKELRRYLQGKREPWVMYNRYTIGS